MKTKLIAILIIAFPVVGLAQSKIQPLKVGDKVPEMVFDMLNRPNPKSNLADYRGKLLIIDCWNIYCGSCIKAMPELAALQRKFVGKVEILALEGGTPIDKVVDFLKQKEKDKQKIELPIAHIKDRKNSVFYELFPILMYGFPVEIWIDAKGMLVGITSSLFVNEEKIQNVLSGNLQVLESRYYQKDFDNEKPLLVQNNGGPDSAFLYRSMITPYIDSIKTDGRKGPISHRTNKFTRLYFPNRTIAELVKTAVYGNAPFVPTNKILELNVQEPTKYLKPKGDANFYRKMRSQGYCYELILPPERTTEEAFSFMLADLERYFKITANLEKRPVKCLVLEKNVGSVLKSTDRVSTYKQEEEKEYSVLTMTNNNFKLVSSFLNADNYPIVIDETEIDYPVDVHLRISTKYDFESLKRSLNEIGLAVSEKIVDQQMLVISEIK